MTPPDRVSTDVIACEIFSSVCDASGIAAAAAASAAAEAATAATAASPSLMRAAAAAARLPSPPQSGRTLALGSLEGRDNALSTGREPSPLRGARTRMYGIGGASGTAACHASTCAERSSDMI